MFKNILLKVLSFSVICKDSPILLSTVSTFKKVDYKKNKKGGKRRRKKRRKKSCLCISALH